MKILLVGSGAAGLQTFKQIRRRGHQLTAVLSTPAPYEFRGASLSGLAEKEGVPIWPGTLVTEPCFAAVVRAHQVDLLLNVNSLHRICPEVLVAPRIGAFNFHPSLLPDYAGLNAPSWAVFHGEKSHGATIHWVVPTIDAGSIAYQGKFPIEDQDTCATVSFNCVKLGLALIDKLLHAAESDASTIPRIAQDLTRRRYFRAGPPQRGCIRWATPAREIVNFLRACEYRPFPSPWGHPRIRLGGTQIHLVSARSTGQATDQLPGIIGQVSDAGAMVSCVDEWLLVSELLIGDSYQRAATLLRTGCRLEDISEAD